VENAIIHGLFHKQGKGFLNVQFLQGASSTELICIIEDDGVGRIRVSEIKKESVAKYDSYGTKLTQQLIEIFKEYESMHIYLEYIDKEKPHTGTIAKLTIRNLKYEA
jgi:two-component sensor histidine kinase